MNALFNIFLGVISGVFTTLCLLWFKNIFTPWYEDRLYKGVVLTGKWIGIRKQFSKFDKDKIFSTLEINLEITQNGYHVSGVFNARSTIFDSNEKPNDVYENLYKLKGKVTDNYTVIDYCPISRNRTGLGAFVLQVKNGGKKLVGGVSFLNEDEMDISSIAEIELNREEK
jgi:hypothetical protein